MTTQAIYLRLSQDREGDALGVERHEEAIRAAAAREGITDFRMYVDNDISASTRSHKPRPDYDRLVRDAADGTVTQVWAYSMSRLTRRPSQGEDIIRLAENHRLIVRTVASGDPNLTTADGRMAFRFIMAADAAEAERISERVALRYKQRMAKGGNGGGVRRFGYSADGRELIGPEADAIRWAYEQILRGASLLSISNEWNRRGLIGPQGAAMRPNKVRGILMRAQNAGLATYKGEIVGPSQLPAIVSEDIWRDARAVMEDPSRKVSMPGRPVRGMLAGIARCSRCDSPAYTRSRNGASVGPFYQCHAAGHVTRKMAPTDELVSGLLISWVIEHREELRLPVAPMDQSAVETVRQLREDIDAYGALADSGRLRPVDYAARVEPLYIRLAAAEALVMVEARRPAAAALAAAQDVSAAWSALDVDGRRAVVRDLVASVVLLPGRQGDGTFRPETIDVIWQPLGDDPTE